MIKTCCMTNCKVAPVCGKPMMGSYSHKLNLEVYLMIHNMKDMNKTISSIHTMIKAAKSKVKNKTMLRNMIHLATVLPNTAQWSSNYEMITHIVHVQRELITVRSDKRCILPMGATNVVAEKAEEYGKMPKEINCSPKY